MKLRNIALLASLTVFAAAVSAAPKKAPPKPVAAKVDPKVAKAEAEAKAKAEAEAKAKAEAAKAPEGPPDKASWFNVGGNLVQGYTYNPQHPSDGYNGTLTWTDRANEYQLNQAWLFFEIPTDTSKKDFDFGLRVDTMFGSSYRWATSAGFEDKLFKTNTGNGSSVASNQYGLAIPQAYVDLAYKALKLRVGHIISPVGFFTVDTTQNVFNTIPYTYAYGEPFTHWGAFLYWTASDKLTLMGGATRGGDNLDGAGVGSKVPGFLGTLSYIFDDKSTFDWVVHVSKEYNYHSSTTSNNPAQSYALGSYNPDPSLYSWRYFQTLVYKRPLTSTLQLVVQSDFGLQKVADMKSALDATNPQKDKEVTAMWYGANVYLIHQTLQTLQLAVNFEWFRDNNGVRVGNVLPTYSAATTGVRGMGSNYLAGGRLNYVGNFFQVTFGPKWQPQKNFFVRLNGRYDYFDGTALNATTAATIAGSTDAATRATDPAALPFGNGGRKDQFVIGLDAALLF
jgi:Putative beta-barrel porin-2, OmpL-like. bbp2